MTDHTSGNRAFRELENQNPAVARAFRSFRQQARPATPLPVLAPSPVAASAGSPAPPSASAPARAPMPAPARKPAPRVPPIARVRRDSGKPAAPRPRSMTVNVAAVFILVAGVVALAIAIGPRAVRWLADNWQAILLPAGCVLVGAGLVLLVSRSGTAPLRAIDPPREDGGNPLQELKSLAERTADRLRGAYRFELLSTLVVGAIFAGLVVWSLVMVSQQRLLYASAFGSGSVAMAVLSRWKWQPFDRINQARRLADNADTLATGLRLRMATIAEIPEPRERARAQWEAVEEYLARS